MSAYKNLILSAEYESVAKTKLYQYVSTVKITARSRTSTGKYEQLSSKWSIC